MANFWFASDRIFRWLDYLSVGQCTVLSAVCLLAFSAPSLRLLYRKVSPKSLSLSLFSVSLVFYLFSIHVHEKTIMVPALASLLCYQQLGYLVIDFQLMGYFTLSSLMIIDGLTLQYCLYGVFYFLFAYLLTSLLNSFSFFSKAIYRHWSLKYFRYALLTSQFCLLYARLQLSPPARLPYLWPTLTCILSFLHFLSTYLYTTLYVLHKSKRVQPKQKIKKM